MQSVVNELIAWQLHPVVDHFSIALVIIAVAVDLVASLLPSRLWIRYTAVTLIVLGAIAVAGSNLTGGWEADKVWDQVTGPAKDVLKRHAQLGDILPWAIGGLALLRLGIQFLGFLGGLRPVYLVIAIVAVGAIIYQGHEGGELVYTYGIGTAVMPTEAATPSSSMVVPPVTAPPVVPSSAPTLFVPPAAATPAAGGSPSPSAEVSPFASPAPSIVPSPAPSVEASPVPTPSPASSGGTPVTPPSGASVPSTAASPGAPKSL
jgi:uncharacterized membrane protein